MPKMVRVTAGFAAGVAVIFIIAAYMILQEQSLLFGISTVARLVFTLPYIVIFLTIITLIMVVLAWKNKYWSAWGRVHYSLVALGLLYFTWFAWYWNLMGLNIYG